MSLLQSGEQRYTKTINNNLLKDRSAWDCICARGRRDSSAGRTSDRKARSNTDAGSSPRCGKGIFAQSRLSVQSLLRCLYIPLVQSHASMSVLMLKSPTPAAIPLFGRPKILHTHTLVGVGSAAPVAADVPYPGRRPESFPSRD